MGEKNHLTFLFFCCPSFFLSCYFLFLLLSWSWTYGQEDSQSRKKYLLYDCSSIVSLFHISPWTHRSDFVCSIWETSVLYCLLGPLIFVFQDTPPVNFFLCHLFCYYPLLRKDISLSVSFYLLIILNFIAAHQFWIFNVFECAEYLAECQPDYSLKKSGRCTVSWIGSFHLLLVSIWVPVSLFYYIEVFQVHAGFELGTSE